MRFFIYTIDMAAKRKTQKTEVKNVATPVETSEEIKEVTHSLGEQIGKSSDRKLSREEAEKHLRDAQTRHAQELKLKKLVRANKPLYLHVTTDDSENLAKLISSAPSAHVTIVQK